MSLSHVMCETAATRGRRPGCRTADGQVQLPGNVLLQARDAAGKHCSVTGVSETARDWTCAWVDGGSHYGRRNCGTVHSYIAFCFYIYGFLSGTKPLAQCAPAVKCTLLSKVIVIQRTEPDCISPAVSESSTAAQETPAESEPDESCPFDLTFSCGPSRSARWKWKLDK